MREMMARGYQFLIPLVIIGVIVGIGIIFILFESREDSPPDNLVVAQVDNEEYIENPTPTDGKMAIVGTGVNENPTSSITATVEPTKDIILHTPDLSMEGNTVDDATLPVMTLGASIPTSESTATSEIDIELQLSEATPEISAETNNIAFSGNASAQSIRLSRVNSKYCYLFFALLMILFSGVVSVITAC